MSKNIKVEVNSIRLEETSETPILLLLDPSTQKGAILQEKSFSNPMHDAFHCTCELCTRV